MQHFYKTALKISKGMISRICLQNLPPLLSPIIMPYIMPVCSETVDLEAFPKFFQKQRQKKSTNGVGKNSFSAPSRFS